MPRTPDRFPGEREEEAIKLEPASTVPTVNGEFRYVTGVGFRFFEEGIERGLDEDGGGGGGLTTVQHRALRQLIHLADGVGGPFEGFTSGAYREVTGGHLPTSIIWYTDSSKTTKIVQKSITYNSNKTPDTVSWTVFDTDGSTVLCTTTDTITYSGAFETERTRSITTSGSSFSLTSANHPALRQLIHLADGAGGPFDGFASGAYRETLPAGNFFPTSVIWWESSAKIKKIVEKTITYTAQKLVDSVSWTVYDTDGTTALATATDTVTYSSFAETDRTRVLT